MTILLHLNIRDTLLLGLPWEYTCNWWLLFCVSPHVAGAPLIHFLILFAVLVLQVFSETSCGASLGGHICIAKNAMITILETRMMSGIMQFVKSPKFGGFPSRLEKMMGRISCSSGNIFSITQCTINGLIQDPH
jgi:hypothetical protein